MGNIKLKKNQNTGFNLYESGTFLWSEYLKTTSVDVINVSRTKNARKILGKYIDTTTNDFRAPYTKKYPPKGYY